MGFPTVYICVYPWLIGIVASASVDERVRGLLEEALQHCETGDHAGAEQLCREALIVDREVPDAWNILAQLFYQHGRLAEAKEAAEQATTLRPEIPPYWLSRGNIELALHDLAAARLSLTRAVELNPTFAEAHYRLGMSFLLDNRITDAVASFRSALRYAGNIAEIHYQLARALSLEGRWEHAMRAYQDAFTRDPAGELDRRPCLDFMRHLHWNALPEFWNGEVGRFFARTDVDKARYVSVALRMLEGRDAFRAALAAPRHSAETLLELMRNELFCALLRDTIIPDSEFESMLTALRAQLLFKPDLRAGAPIAFLCALAQQCFNNDFVYAETESERGALTALATEVEGKLQDGDDSESLVRAILALALYRPVYGVANIDGLVAAAQADNAVLQWLQRCVIDVCAEQQARTEAAAVTIANRDSGPSEAVARPRWYSFDRFTPVPFNEWLASELARPGAVNDVREGPRMLVAGCGTGQNAISLATAIAGARVLAVDDSPAKVAYARRMANQFGVDNIEFRCTNFAELPADERYDVVFGEGALRQAADAEDALRALAALLRPAGWLKLAFYSERARTSVNEARQLVRDRRIEPSAPAIREFRQHVFALGKRAALTPVTWFHQFYSTDGCCDLLFHDREQQYRLPQVAELVAKAGLELVGLSNIPLPARAAYARAYPEDPAGANLANWDAFEAEHPETFMGMFDVWARAR